MFKIMEFDGVILTKENFILMDGRKLAVVLGFNKEIVEPSDVIGMAKLQIADDGIYAEVDFFAKAIKPTEAILLDTEVKLRDIEGKPYLVYLNIILPKPGEGRLQFCDDKLVDVSSSLFDKQRDSEFLEYSSKTIFSL